MTHDSLPHHLVWCLRGGYAHCGVETAFDDVPPAMAGRVPRGFPHSLWQLMEHVRICQRDLIDYSTVPGHTSPMFPHGLWPASPRPPREDAYEESLAAYLADLEELCGLVLYRDPLAPLPNGPAAGERDGPHTLLRTATIALDHQAYHAGQAVAVRKALGCWSG